MRVSGSVVLNAKPARLHTPNGSSWPVNAWMAEVDKTNSYAAQHIILALYGIAVMKRYSIPSVEKYEISS